MIFLMISDEEQLFLSLCHLYIIYEEVSAILFLFCDILTLLSLQVLYIFISPT